MKNILIIEDDVQLAKSLRELFNVKFNANICINGSTGYKETLTNKYALIVLDLHLPDQQGVNLITNIRASLVEVPILVLTSISHTDSIVTALQCGADDYVCKPFSTQELYARAERLIQKPPLYLNNNFIWRNINLDADNLLISSNNKSIKLRKKELEILLYLIKNSGSTVSRDKIISNIWSHLNEIPYKGTVDVHVSNLRRKLKELSNKHQIITIHGVGYKLL